MITLVRRTRASTDLAIGSVLSALALVCVAVTALYPIRVTHGWIDQEHFHMPTIVGFAQALPAVDFVDVQTATGPLYHLVLAVPMRVFFLSETATQVLGGWLFWTALVAVTLWATRALPWPARATVVVVVLASPYVWQGTLWATTDTAALVLVLLSLVLLTRLDGTLRTGLLAGVASAAAIATRQTAAWLLLPGVVSAFAHAGARRVKLTSAAAVCLPGIVVLALLVAAWGGLTPPAFADYNGAGANPAGIPFGFAFWAFLATPLALVARHQHRPADVRLAALAGSVAASPAVIWPSAYLEEGSVREGGWLWLLVRVAGDVADRSPLLVVLAFLGAASLTLIALRMRADGQLRLALMTGAAVVGAVVASSAATQAFQKYFEIPLIACWVVLVVAVWNAERERGAPLVALAVPAAVQLVSLAALVGIPVVTAL